MQPTTLPPTSLHTMPPTQPNNTGGGEFMYEVEQEILSYFPCILISGLFSKRVGCSPPLCTLEYYYTREVTHCQSTLSLATFPNNACELDTTQTNPTVLQWTSINFYFSIYILGFKNRLFVADQQERCADRASQTDCEGWKKAGFCVKHEALIYHCKKTCNLCSSGKDLRNFIILRIVSSYRISD